MSAQEIIDRVIQTEAGYVNDPADSGGETIWGITARLARAHGYSAPMRAMTRDQARAIYHAEFWRPLNLDAVDALSELVAHEVMDTAVNMGKFTAVAFLQRALNVLNLQGSLYPDLAIDGALGAATVAALKKLIEARRSTGVTVLLRMLNCLQGARYIELAEQRQKDERFVLGWFDKRVAM